MPLTEETVIHKAWNLATSQGVVPQDFPRERFLPLIPEALTHLGWTVFRSPEYRTLRQDFAFTPASGVVDLTASTELIPESIKKGSIRLASSDSTVFVMARSRNDMKVTPPSGVVIWELATTTNGVALNFSDATSITNFSSPIVITANCIPTLADLTTYFPQHQDDFFNILVGTINGRGPMNTPAPDTVVKLA